MNSQTHHTSSVVPTSRRDYTKDRNPDSDRAPGGGYQYSPGEPEIGHVLLDLGFLNATYQGHGVWNLRWIGSGGPLQLILGCKLDHASTMLGIVSDSLQGHNRDQVAALWHRLAIGQGGHDLSARSVDTSSVSESAA